MIVVKSGGAAGIDVTNVCADVALLVRQGQQVVLVHGGSDAGTTLGRRLGQTPRYLTFSDGVQSRYTDPETLNIMTMAMTGHVNPQIVSQLLQNGVSAIGLSGIDGRLVTAAKSVATRATIDGQRHVIRDNFIGRITGVNRSLIDILINHGYVPVISPPAYDPKVGPVNVDADRIAAALAVALEADNLVLLSNVPGLLRDPTDPTSLVNAVRVDDLREALDIAKDRMKVKVMAATEAVRGGVGTAILGDARRSSPICAALAGEGTVVYGAKVSQEVMK